MIKWSRWKNVGLKHEEDFIRMAGHEVEVKHGHTEELKSLESRFPFQPKQKHVMIIIWH